MAAIKFVPKSKANFNKIEKQEVKSPKKNDSAYYYYIRNGDFDIVWTNVFVFVLGHLLFIHTGYLLVFEHKPSTIYTWFYGKSTTSCTLIQS